MFRKPFRCAAALLSMVMVFQTLPVSALAENPDINVAAIWEVLFASGASDVPPDVPVAEDTGTLDGASKSKPQLTSDMLERIDFSSRRLLVATNDSSIFTEDTQVLSMYDGIYLLAFADEAETMSAYTYYYEIADFVESDSAVFIADNDYITDAEPVFSDSAGDAFTQLNILLSADETAQSGSNNGDSLNFGYNLPKVGFNAFSEKPHYNVAIIDTGVSNGVTDSVSVIGGDGVDDNGHGTAVLSAVKSISDDISVLSIKAFDRRGVGKISAVYAAVAYAVKEGADVINLPFDIESKTDSAVLDRAVSMAKRAGITVVGTVDNNDTAVYAKINNGVIFDKNYIPVGDVGLVDEEYVDLDEFFPENIDYETHDLMSESDSTDHPLLELSELEDETMDAVNSEPVVIAEESDEEIDWSKPPVQDSVTVDNTTIERIHIRWLSTSDGEETPAYFGRLKLAPTSDVVRNQMFQIDFALSGQRAYQPGEIELTFPAYLWLDRNDKEPGTLMLSVPEDPETGVEFVWKRVGNNIVITNAKPLAAASKVMIQGTFRDVAAHDMVDGTVSNKFSATLTVTTPNNKTATMKSNDIDASIDTEAHVSYANKTAYNSVTGTYDVYWTDVPSTIPQELLPEDKDNYAYVRWYVAGTADGNQPYRMYVEDTIAYDGDGEPEYGGIMLGMSDIPENDEDSDVKTSANGSLYKKSSDQKTIKALLYDGYSTIVKSAYVWTAYPKDRIPEEKVDLRNSQTISVTGKDDNITTTRPASATVETKSPTTYKFIKHWSDIVYGEDNHWELRPDEMYLRIFCKEYSSYSPWRTILLTADYSADPSDPNPNDWTYTWSDEGQVRTYSVDEVIDESKRKGTFDEDHERYVDESGHRMEWQYVLRKTEYDEKTHTWTYTNEYDDGWIKFELSTLEKQVEYKYQDSSLKSTRDDLSLNQLLRGKEVYVQYPIDATISVAKQAVWNDFDVNPNRFVLEDAEYYFNENEDLTVNDVDISEVTFDAPVVYRYIDYDKETGEYDKEIIATPETTLYGEVDDEWIPLVILKNNCTDVTEENGAKVETISEKKWKVTMPDDKLVSHIKIEFESDDPEKPDKEKIVATTDMNCTVTLHVKPTDAVKEMINKGFEGNDYLCLPLYNKAKAYAIYIGKEPKHEEDEYGEERSYKTGDPVSEMESPATGYLHGRVYRVAAELEKSFTFNGQYDTTNKRAMLHSELTLTQQSDVTSRSDYDYALKMEEIPNTNSGTYYDLLPYGVEPIVKSVKFANDKDSIKNAWTISNYKDSGRTMLVVEVNLADNITYTSQKKYKEGDGSEYYPEKGYKNTHTLTFDSYCSTDLSAIDNGVLRNVAAYEAAEGEIGNIEDWTGEPDDPSRDNHNQSENAIGSEALEWMTNLDPNSDAPAFVYAGDEVNLSDIPEFAVSSVEKAVSVTGSGEWSKGEKNDVNVQEGGLYSYRLLVTSATDTTTSDIILLDNIEKYVPNKAGEDKGRDDAGDNQWYGTLLSIDLSQVISAGVAPVIYYSTKDDLDISQDAYNPEKTGDKNTVKDILNKAGGDWTKVTLDKLPGVDLSTVKAIAIDMTTDKDGKPFKLEGNEQLIVYLNMRAPYEKDNPEPDYFYDKKAEEQTDGTDHERNAHAYNDIYLNCVQTDLNGKSKASGDYIHNSYTKVGIYTKSVTIKKDWDDDDDADGKRPKKITVRLLDNDGEVVENGEVVLSEENNWTAEIERLLTYDDEGNYINYTFVEEFEGVGEYKLTVKRTIKEDGSIIYTLNNYREPEKIDIPVTKTWQDSDQSKRPAYITVKLYAKYPDSDERVLVETIKIDSSNNWKGIFEGLNKYAKGKRIEYTVEEEPVYDYVPAEPTGNPKKAEDGFTILNEYYPYGNLIITKHVENGTGEARKKEFTFTLTLETQDGKDVTDRYDYIIYDSKGNPTDKKGKIGNGGEFTLKDGERIEIKDIPTHIKYTVTETGKSGFTLTKTVNDTGEIISWPDAEAEFTNEYSASGSAPIDALKLLEGRNLLRNKFKFELYEKIGDGYELLRGDIHNDSDGSIPFGEISYTDKDDGIKHIYKIVENHEEEEPGYIYDETVYYATVTMHDNGDGTMTPDVRYYSDEELTKELKIDIDGEIYNYPVFQNKYEAEGSISFSAWKVLDGRSVRDGEFEFNLYDEHFKRIGIDKTFTNNANGRVDFEDLDELKYDQDDAGKIYWYYAREVKGDDPTVVYDTAVIAYRVEVVDNGDGTLSFNQSSYYVDALKVCETCEGTGKSADADCIDCGGSGYVWKLKDCETCEGDGKVEDDALCEECGGTGKVGDWTIPETSDVPRFNNGLVDGSLSVSKYTQGGTDPDQTFHFKVKLIGEKIKDGGIEYEITDAEDREFPVSEYDTIEWADIFGDADPFSRFSSLNIDEDIESDESNDNYPFYDNLISRLPLLGVYDEANIADDETDDDYPIMPIAAGENPFGTVKWSISGNTLILEPADGYDYGVLGDTTSTSDVPWYSQRSSIQNIQINGDVRTGKNADSLFNSHSSLTSLEGLEKLDVSGTESMKSMFSGCYGLTSLKGLEDWDVSSVTNMQYMFQSCRGLTSLTGLEKWDTGNVTNMQGTFQMCMGLKSLTGLEEWKTGEVTTMKYTFQACDSVASLEALEKWDVSKVQDMERMFAANNTHTFTDLKGLEKWNVGNVKSMKYMFSYCKALKSTEALINWDVSKVQDMEEMFSYCQSLETLEGLTNWDVRSVDTMTGMFKNNGTSTGGTLKSLKGLENWDVSGVTNMSHMFEFATALESVEALRNWTIGAVDMTNMFEHCYWSEYKNGVTVYHGLKSLKGLENWDVSKATDLAEMFAKTYSLTDADLSGWNPSINISPGGSVLYTCNHLEKVYLDNWTYSGSAYTYPASDDSNGISEIRFSKDAFAAFLLPEPKTSDSAGNKVSSGRWVNKADLAKGPEVYGYTSDELASKGQLDETVQTYVWQSYYTIKFEIGTEHTTDGMANRYGSVKFDYDIAGTPKSGDGYIVTGWRDEDGNVYSVIDDVATIPKGTYNHEDVVTLYPIWSRYEASSAEMQDGEFEFWLKSGEKATFDDIPAGTAYQVWEETPDGWVLVKQVNASGVIEPLETANAEFYNLYQPEKTAAVIYGAKLLDNKPANTDADGVPFKFELVDKVNGDPDNDYVIQAVLAQKGGFIQFEAIEYEEKDVGEHVYIVREVNSGNSDIKYDTREWEVTVTVTKTADGVLGTTVKYKDLTNGSESDGGVRFENTTLPGSLELTKIGDGVTEENKDTMFKFRIKLYNENGMPLTDGSYNWYIKDAETGEILSKDNVDLVEGNDDTGSDNDEQLPEGYEQSPDGISTLSMGDDYSVMPIANIIAGGEWNTVKWRIEDNTLILEPKDGEAYGVLGDSTVGSDVPWYEQRSSVQAIRIKGDVRAGKKADYLFYDCTNLKSVKGLANLDVSGTVSMESMFSNCKKLTSLNGLGVWDVRNVENMGNMFAGCSELTSIKALKEWEVGKVNDAQNMFSMCISLTSIEGLENWDVSGLKGVDCIKNMFNGCYVLKSIEPLRNWDVSNVTSLDSMFQNCFAIESLEPLSDWNVRNVANMENTFSYCQSLNSLEGLEKWTVTGVDSMSAMFKGCHSLKSVEALRGWNVSGVTNMEKMFEACGDPGGTIRYTGLTSLSGLEDWDVSSVTKMDEMFNMCNDLIVADLSGWAPKAEAKISLTKMIGECPKLEKLYLDKWRYTPIGYDTFNYKTNNISEIRFSEEAFRSCTLPTPTYGKSTGKWVKKADLSKGINEAGFYPYQLHEMAAGVVAGETYVWQAYYNIDFTLSEYSSIRTRAREYGSVKYDYDILGEPDPARDGYVFTGWKDQNGNVYSVIDGKATIPADGRYEHNQTITLTDQWAKVGEKDVTYYVDYYHRDVDSDSYTLADSIGYSAESGKEVEAPLKNYDGLITPTETKKAIVPAEDGELHVAYYYERTRYTVHFVGNGADGGSMSDLKMTGGIARALGNGFTKIGYAFRGWSTEPTGEVRYYSSEPVMNLAENGKTITLYAQWWQIDESIKSGQSEIIVSCKAGQTIVIEGLPAGTTYEIEEIDVPYGWEITDQNNVSGTIMPGKASAASVTNKYSTNGMVSIMAHKMLEGGDLSSGMFEFELWEDKGEPQTVISHTDNYDDDGNRMANSHSHGPNAAFPVTIPGAKKLHVEMKYHAVYNNQPITVSPIPIGMSTGRFIAGANNELESEFDIDGDTVTFTTYTANTSFYAVVTEVTAPVDTVVNGTVDEMIESVDDNGNTVTNKWYGTAPVIFSNLEFTKTGVYRYYIKEKTPADADGIVYDEHIKYVTVNVTDNGDGTLNCEVIYDEDGDEPLFKNIVSGELEVAKILEDAANIPDEIKDTEFSFLVELKDAEGNPLSGEYNYTVYNSDGEPIEEKSGTVTVVDGKAENYIHIKSGEKFKVYGLPSGAQYTVTEKDAKGFELKEKTGDTGTIVAGGTSEVEFTNVYTGLVRLYLSAMKEFRGGEIGEEMFLFRLTQVTEDGQLLDVLQEVYADTEGKIIFDPIDFTDEDIDKVFFFAVTEVNGGLDGVQYDKHRAIIKVSVAKDEDGNLILVTDYTDDNDTDKVISGQVVSITDTKEEDLVFVNNTLFDLDVSKTVTFGEQERDFNFTLTLTNENGLPDSIGWEKSDIDFGTVDITENSQEFVYEFTLKHGETIKFKGLPYGTEYTIVEEQDADYRVQATTSTGDEAGVITEGETAGGTINADVSVEYLNQRIPKLPETGGRGMKTVGLGAALLLAGLSGWFYSRKRRYRRT